MFLQCWGSNPGAVYHWVPAAVLYLFWAGFSLNCQEGRQFAILPPWPPKELGLWKKKRVKIYMISQAWWCMPISWHSGGWSKRITASSSQPGSHDEFKANLDYTTTLSKKQQQQKLPKTYSICWVWQHTPVILAWGRRIIMSSRQAWVLSPKEDPEDFGGARL